MQKEFWEMTQKEYINFYIKTGIGLAMTTGKPFVYPPPNQYAIELWKRNHRHEVKQAIRNRFSIPTEVLVEYQEYQKSKIIIN